MLYAHVVIMLYAHVVSSYYCTLGLYACTSVYSINSRDQPRCSPCVDYTTMCIDMYACTHGQGLVFH